ncbi:MAG: hypothetical protein JHC33_08505 [Ignisphaera sp.]|nr:hypothetical protein [Ignisphaera sp.]
MGLLAVIDLEKLVDVLARLPTEVAHEIARAKGVDDISRVVAKMPVDEAADFLSKLPTKVRTEVLKLLPKDFEK